MPHCNTTRSVRRGQKSSRGREVIASRALTDSRRASPRDPSPSARASESRACVAPAARRNGVLKSGRPTGGMSYSPPGTRLPRSAWLALTLAFAAIHHAAGFTEECPTYYVNLDKSEDRRERVERLFAPFKHLHRVPGIDGHSKSSVMDVLSSKCPPSMLPNSFDEGNLGVHRGDGTYLSRLGCTLSHVKAILKAHDDERDYALILEDDATPDLVPTWHGTLRDFVETLPEDWTIVQLSALSYGDKLTDLFVQWQETRLNTNEPGLTTLPKNAGSLIWSAQAYLVSKRGMSQIAGKYRREDGTIDICSASCLELDDCILHEGVDAEGYRIATPPLFVPRQDMTSTIGQKDDGEEGNVVEMDETRKMYEESRDVLYQWAGSWALNGYERANLDVDAQTLRDVVDSFYDDGKREAKRLKEGSFEKALRAHCEKKANDCKIKHGWLKNVVDPRKAAAQAEAESRRSKGHHSESTLGTESLNMAMDASNGTLNLPRTIHSQYDLMLNLTRNVSLSNRTGNESWTDWSWDDWTDDPTLGETASKQMRDETAVVRTPEAAKRIALLGIVPRLATLGEALDGSSSGVSGSWIAVGAALVGAAIAATARRQPAKRRLGGGERAPLLRDAFAAEV